MDETVIYIILGIVFFIFRAFMGSKKNKNAPKPNKKPRRPKPNSSDKDQSFDDIFGDFKTLMKEIENKNKPPKQPETRQQSNQKRQPIPNTMKAEMMQADPLEPEKMEKPELDWQEVSRPKKLTKERLVDRSETRIEPVETTIKATEIKDDEGYYYDIEEIDWRDAIISKEVLDRRY